MGFFGREAGPSAALRFAQDDKHIFFVALLRMTRTLFRAFSQEDMLMEG